MSACLLVGFICIYVEQMSDESAIKIKSAISLEIYRQVNSKSCRDLSRKKGRNNQSINKFQVGARAASDPREEEEFSVKTAAVKMAAKSTTKTGGESANRSVHRRLGTEVGDRRNIKANIWEGKSECVRRFFRRLGPSVRKFWRSFGSAATKNASGLDCLSAGLASVRSDRNGTRD